MCHVVMCVGDFSLAASRRKSKFVPVQSYLQQTICKFLWKVLFLINILNLIKYDNFNCDKCVILFYFKIDFSSANIYKPPAIALEHFSKMKSVPIVSL